MKKKTEIDQKSLEIFREAVKGVKQLKRSADEKVPIEVKLKRSSPGTRRPGESRDPAFISEENTGLFLNESDDAPSVGSETTLNYHQPGISHKTLRNLRKGQYNVEGILDLHGMTISEAKAAVEKFLQERLSAGSRVVLIIHGKGRNRQPILKNKLNQWLRGLSIVLAFCSASTAHGSRGAIYVLLKALRSTERGD